MQQYVQKSSTTTFPVKSCHITRENYDPIMTLSCSSSWVTWRHHHCSNVVAKVWHWGAKWTFLRDRGVVFNHSSFGLKSGTVCPAPLSTSSTQVTHGTLQYRVQNRRKFKKSQLVSSLCNYQHSDLARLSAKKVRELYLLSSSLMYSLNWRTRSGRANSAFSNTQ
jgi:hypothetical protein